MIKINDAIRKEYWTSEQIIEKEAFAHFFGASVTSKIKAEIVKRFFPRAYDEFLRMVDDMKWKNQEL